jgi:SAM-dependent methyltransferase
MLGPDKELQRRHFDRIAEEFDTRYNVYKSKTGRLRADRRACFFSESCRLTARSQVLELGCGTGEYTLRLASSGAKIFSVDISARMLEVARRKVRFSNVYFQLADIESLPFEDGSFDACLGNAVLHHLDLNCAFKEIKRVLKGNGKIAFSEPNMLNPQVFLQKRSGIFKRLAGDFFKETAFFSWQLRDFLEKQGFGEIVIKPADFLHPATPDFLAAVVENISKGIERIPFIRQLGGSLFITATLKKD